MAGWFPPPLADSATAPSPLAKTSPCHLLLPHAPRLALSSVHAYMPICLFSPLYNRLRHTRRSRYDTLPCHTEPALSKVEGPVLSFAEGKGIGIVFPYFQKNGSHLALQLDITSETIPLLRHNTTPPLNAISRLTTIFTTHKKRLMSSGNPQPRTEPIPPCPPTSFDYAQGERTPSLDKQPPYPPMLQFLHPPSERPV